jgi:hypothetical protein
MTNATTSEKHPVKTCIFHDFCGVYAQTQILGQKNYEKSGSPSFLKGTCHFHPVSTSSDQAVAGHPAVPW